MDISFKRITIIRKVRPKESSLNEDLQWLSQSLGLFGERDREKSCFRVFLELLKAEKEGKILSSDVLAKRAHISRGTVIHHMTRLLESGLVTSTNKRYRLKVQDLEGLILGVEQEVYRVLEELRSVAKEIDEDLEVQ
ncbi:winged helix-turn-helix transcriptional regulator [Candidatus Woesearchaeota archaeon]|nr:winged helix-turn-helix transcriptional regulator [Candidatus Woesearchaeota archaeon]